MTEKAKQISKAIDMMKKWITLALASSNYQADFSMESLKDIDRFFDEQNTEDGILSKNTEVILFALGVYVGETIISNYGGQWELEECENKNTIKLKVNDETVLFPVIRVMARYQYGSANRLYAYGQRLNKERKSTDEEKCDMMNIEEIWRIEDKCSFVIAMYKYIADKCEYGEKTESLNDEQKVVYTTQALEMEVNNGGFSQFFFNSDGMFANELVSSFEKIGAMKTAEICKKAVSIYGDSVPVDRDKREDMLTSDDEEIDALLDECDNSFFEYEDDLTELNYQYIIKNKDSFSK